MSVTGQQATLDRFPPQKSRNATPQRLLLESMSVEEFDALQAGDVTADELYQRHGVER